jgi:predicted nucleic acid-binding protein
LTFRSSRPKFFASTRAHSGRILFEDTKNHRAYLEFITRAVQARSTLIYSELLDLELAQLCVKAARSRHHGRREQSIPEGRALIHDTFGRWRDIYTETDSVRVTLAGGDEPGTIGSPVRAGAFYLIEHHGLDSYDATHAATALTYGASILTADLGFADVPAQRLEIITDADSIEDFRRRRS